MPQQEQFEQRSLLAGNLDQHHGDNSTVRGLCRLRCSLHTIQSCHQFSWLLQIFRRVSTHPGCRCLPVETISMQACVKFEHMGAVKRRPPTLEFLPANLARTPASCFPRRSNSEPHRVLTTLFYLCFGTVYYFSAFDQSKKDPKRFRQSQIWSEIRDSLHTIFWCCLLMAPVMTAQIRGHSKIYAFGSASWWYEIAQYPLFVLFSDTWMYWMHRLFHHPILFRRFHSKHHR